MIRYRCDGCGLDLAGDGSDRYVVRIEAFAAAGRLEFTEEDMRRDHAAEIERLLSRLEKQSPDEIEDQVYRRLVFDLCPDCHRLFLRSPLAALARRQP